MRLDLTQPYAIYNFLVAQGEDRIIYQDMVESYRFELGTEIEPFQLGVKDLSEVNLIEGQFINAGLFATDNEDIFIGAYFDVDKNEIYSTCDIDMEKESIHTNIKRY